LLCLTFVAAAVGAYGGTLPPPVDLSSGVGGGHFPIIAVDTKGNVDVAWSFNGIFFTRSVDGGTTFSRATTVQLGPAPFGLQMVLEPDGNVNLLWQANVGPNGSHFAMFFSRSDDGGLTFSVPKNLSPNLGSVRSFSPQLAVDRGGHIDIAWLDSRTGGGLFFIRSTDEGASFSAPAKVWTVVAEPDPLSLRTATGPNGQVYLVWTKASFESGCAILFSRSLDGGVTFSSPAQLSNDPVGQCSDNPVPLVDSSGNIDVVWTTTEDFSFSSSVFFSRSTNEGATFSVPKSPSGILPFFSLNEDGAQIAVDPDGEIEVVWSVVPAGTAVFFASSANHGATFSTPSILSIPPGPNSSGAFLPVIGVGPSGKIGVAWQDHGPASLGGSNFDIFFRRSTDEGGTFSNPVNLSNAPNQVKSGPQIAVDSHGSAYVVWEGSNPSNVFFSRVPASSSLGDFKISVSPKSMSALQGEVLHFDVNGRALGALNDVVNLSCSDLPGSATCTFNPPSVTARPSGSAASLTVTVPATLSPGTYLFTVNGVGGATIDTQTVELTVSAPGSFISNVQVTNVSSTSATITWATNQPADTQVAYFIGSAKPTWSACCNPTNATSHSLTLTGLAPNTTYNFFVESTPTGSSTPVDSSTSMFSTLTATKTVTTSSIATANR
jgi:Fibronectin type III domain